MNMCGNRIQHRKEGTSLRQFCYQEAPGPREALRGLRELSRQWLSPETHTHEGADPGAAGAGAVPDRPARGAPGLGAGTAPGERRGGGDRTVRSGAGAGLHEAGQQLYRGRIFPPTRLPLVPLENTEVKNGAYFQRRETKVCSLNEGQVTSKLNCALFFTKSDAVLLMPHSGTNPLETDTTHTTRLTWLRCRGGRGSKPECKPVGASSLCCRSGPRPSSAAGGLPGRFRPRAA